MRKRRRRLADRDGFAWRKLQRTLTEALTTRGPLCRLEERDVTREAVNAALGLVEASLRNGAPAPSFFNVLDDGTLELRHALGSYNSVTCRVSSTGEVRVDATIIHLEE